MNNGNDVNWSSLPTVVLWMIKDKLDIFDSMCLEAVCRDWWFASLNYPKKQVVGDGMPWIMQQNDEENSNSHEFISITRKKRFTIDLPEFRNCQVLFSKQGWVLMRKKNFCESYERLPDSLFLMNPFTKAKIELPAVAEIWEYYGCFSTKAGVPKQVVLLGAGKSCETMLRTNYIGDAVWNEHFSIDHPIVFEGCRGLVSTKEQIYYINIWGKMIIYDMVNQCCRELSGSRNEMGVNYIVEHEGNIIKLLASDYGDKASFSISTYSDSHTKWQGLSNDEMNNLSLYLSRSHNCFCARDRGLNAYVLQPNYGGLPYPRLLLGYNVLYYDVADGNTQVLQQPYKISATAKWVDIG